MHGETVKKKDTYTVKSARQYIPITLHISNVTMKRQVSFSILFTTLV
jgi:hypothetical protein